MDCTVEVDQNISQQDHQLCDYINREGRLCGACKENHFISSYSYDLKCYQCPRGLLSNILMYLDCGLSSSNRFSSHSCGLSHVSYIPTSQCCYTYLPESCISPKSSNVYPTNAQHTETPVHPIC